MNMNRRTFLKNAMGAAAVVTLPPIFHKPAWAAAGKRVKEFHFSASPTRVSLGAGPEFEAWTYNGQIPGPEIRVKEGDIVRVGLKNFLPESTTIHWHGIPLPNAMDGVPGITQPAVQPGGVFVYEFEARPAGTFIYHSHVKYQMDQGLYGALIIEPQNQRESYDREYSLVLEDWVMKDGGGTADTERRPPMGMMGSMMGRRRRFSSGDGPLLEPVYDGYAVNGRAHPAVKPLAVRQGDRVKLRIANVSSANIYYLRLAGHRMTITHADGNPVKPVKTDVLQIGMGERYDVMFEANNPGNWFLAAYDSGLGEGQLRVPVSYAGVQQKTAVMPTFSRDIRMATYWDFEALEPQAEAKYGREKVFNQTLSGAMHSSLWSINGQVYPDVDPMIVRTGERVRLRYGNHSPMPHPMHMHGHFFKIVNPDLPPELWVSKDTAVLDRMQRIDVAFMADNPGKWFHHCHNLYHMEAGMANVIDVRS